MWCVSWSDFCKDRRTNIHNKQSGKRVVITDDPAKKIDEKIHTNYQFMISEISNNCRIVFYFIQNRFPQKNLAIEDSMLNWHRKYLRYPENQTNGIYLDFLSRHNTEWEEFMSRIVISNHWWTMRPDNSQWPDHKSPQKPVKLCQQKDYSQCFFMMHVIQRKLLKFTIRLWKNWDEPSGINIGACVWHFARRT